MVWLYIYIYIYRYAHVCQLYGGYMRTCLHRFALMSILRLHPGSLVVLAPVCSSFSYMCSSQSKRAFYWPQGDESISWVRCGNIMNGRVTLLAWLCVACGCTFLIEQPADGCFNQLPRFQQLCAKVYVSCFQ